MNSKTKKEKKKLTQVNAVRHILTFLTHEGVKLSLF